jgi:hypothetical protein
VAQIVRNRTGHAADGRQALGVNQFPLRFLQVRSHAVEGPRNLGHFVASAQLERIGEIAHFERTHPGDQIF